MRDWQERLFERAPYLKNADGLPDHMAALAEEGDTRELSAREQAGLSVAIATACKSVRSARVD